MEVMSGKAKANLSSVKCPSYLLVIDGSAASLSAAHLAWDLANSTKGKVVAQHVLDTPAVWSSLAYSIPGLIGSGAYIEAQKKITEALRSLAETVMLSYSAQAEGQHQESESIIDEGDTISEICRRSLEHDMVIVGEVYDNETGPSDKSLGYRITEHCKKPVIIVQSGTTPRSGQHLIIANKSFANSELIDSVLAFAKSASIPAK